ncbi:MAG: hypothetical protein VX796_03875, partial [Pseudomonadota bacterium]|nr:hypothetical protein [Pseudomonadota bacterium]
VVDDSAHRDILYRGELAARITPVPDREHARTLTLDDRQGDYRLTIDPMRARDDGEAPMEKN